MSKTKPKKAKPKVTMGRPRITPVEVANARQRVLWRVRNRALSILAQRHPDEFAAIKNTLLAESGLDPIDGKFSVTPTKVTIETGLEDLT